MELLLDLVVVEADLHRPIGIGSAILPEETNQPA
jgi:hypothetical protein